MTIEVPEEFAILARAMSVTEAARYWRISKDRVRRYALAMGEDFHAAMVENGRYAVRTASSAQGRKNSAAAKQGAGRSEETLEARVMRFISRRWPCYSSRIYGETDNVYYFIGSRRVDWDELLATARRYGFQE